MSALLKMPIARVPFALRQHVAAKDHQGIGDPNGDWNWEPPVPKNRISFDDRTSSQRTRSNTNGVADVSEFS
jgi:hypothetical protein